MKVTVDDSLCCAYGNCVMICPQVFELPEGATTVQIVSAEVPTPFLETAREAVRDCPTGALFAND
jgi:ferredoxin